MKPTKIPRVKICCIKSEKEAWAAIEAGASALGLVSSMPSGPGVIGDELIAEIARSVPPGVSTFLLTSLRDARDIVKQHSYCGTSTIQLCDYIDFGEYELLRKELKGIKLVQVIHVRDEIEVKLAKEVSGFVDAVLLDSGNTCLGVKELGGTGRVHDWRYSVRIREELSIPVYLAGGIRAGLVHDAITQVGPFGLDLCSGVRTNDNLDVGKLTQFFEALSIRQS